MREKRTITVRSEEKKRDRSDVRKRGKEISHSKKAREVIVPPFTQYPSYYIHAFNNN